MDQIVQQYIPLVDFLGKALGKNTEVVLHDLTDYDRSVVAIANSHISGRCPGAPATDLALQLLKDVTTANAPYLVNYQGKGQGRHPLKSSTYFIRNENGEAVGMLCLNSDFQSAVDARLALEQLVDDLGLNGESGREGHVSETLPTDVRELVVSNIRKVYPKEKTRLKQKEKIELIEHLNEMGTFLIKGAVQIVAEEIGVSTPSIYRYLNQVKQEKV